MFNVIFFLKAQGGHGYLKEWLWWSGFLTSILYSISF